MAIGPAPEGSTRAWARVAIIAGLLALAAYLCSVVFKPLPWAVGSVLLALGLARHRAFSRSWCALGALIAAAALVLNLATFPTAPASAGLIDLGPAAGAWYGGTLLLLLRSIRREAEKDEA